MSAITLEGCKEGEKALPGGVCGVPKPSPPPHCAAILGWQDFSGLAEKKKALSEVLRARSPGACFLQDQAFPQLERASGAGWPPGSPLGGGWGLRTLCCAPPCVLGGKEGVRPPLPFSQSPRTFRGKRFWGSFCRRGEECGAQRSFRGCI